MVLLALLCATKARKSHSSLESFSSLSPIVFDAFKDKWLFGSPYITTALHHLRGQEARRRRVEREELGAKSRNVEMTLEANLRLSISLVLSFRRCPAVKNKLLMNQGKIENSSLSLFNTTSMMSCSGRIE